ncbi:5-oxoprolinase subunit PxpB [Microbulbifer hainanensis]|uniref:5-oxoprolinase subunit PxpB n=1 Tax=Microbulbifer hainanensis TaxID=2735675 RepID=UPI0018693EBF|nr:5-oxoprolinase subunit PxpB [Microbulbifer hainanensis]
MQITDAGDESITIYLAETPGEEALARVTQMAALIRAQMADVITDLVPSYCSVTVYYDLLRCDYATVKERLQALMQESSDSNGEKSSAESAEGRLVELPVYYGAEVAPDLERVAADAGLDIDGAIAMHSGAEYRVYALGFRPGFAFMGMTPEPLRAPRLENPRPRVAAGSVAIAGAQAAVYPDACPGGWNILGRCPVKLFDRASNPPQVLLQVGDRVRFAPVTRAKFLELGGVLDD